MPKAEWGKKVICSNCEAKFYDLNRKPVTCPVCGTEQADPSNEFQSTSTKHVFTDNVDVISDDNLVGSDASESIAEVEDLEIDSEMDDDTISLEETESDVSVSSEDVDDIDIGESPQDNIDREE